MESGLDDRNKEQVQPINGLRVRDGDDSFLFPGLSARARALCIAPGLAQAEAG